MRRRGAQETGAYVQSTHTHTADAEGWWGLVELVGGKAVGRQGHSAHSNCLSAQPAPPLFCHSAWVVWHSRAREHSPLPPLHHLHTPHFSHCSHACRSSSPLARARRPRSASRVPPREEDRCCRGQLLLMRCVGCHMCWQRCVKPVNRPIVTRVAQTSRRAAQSANTAPNCSSDAAAGPHTLQ